MSSVRLRLAPPGRARGRGIDPRPRFECGGAPRQSSQIASGIARRRLATGIEIVKEERDRLP